MKSAFILHAPNVHQGGGAVLLNALLAVLIKLPSNINILLHLDTRYNISCDLPNNCVIKKFSPTYIDRLKAEFELYKSSNKNTIVLCFGSLPPLFSIKGEILLFLQNRNLIDKVSFRDFPLHDRIRISIERFWLKLCVNKVDKCLVQSATMAQLFKSNINSSITTLVTPFLDKPLLKRSDNSSIARATVHGFIFVGSGEPHKNHKRLIEAWCLLSDEGIRPSLCITLDQTKYNDLIQWINKKIEEFHLSVTNLENIRHEDMGEILANAQACIFPSLRESFGLPLMEAKLAGIPIIASELDYVRDIIDPDYSFDPYSPVSIARAIKRYLKLPSSNSQVIDVYTFMQMVIS